MDVKNTPNKYGQTIGKNHYDIAPIQKSIAILLSDTVPYEFRTTVVREFHTSEDILSLAQWIEGVKKYYLQNFVDSDDVLKSGLRGYSREELQQFLELIRPIIPSAELRGI